MIWRLGGEIRLGVSGIGARERGREFSVLREAVPERMLPIVRLLAFAVFLLSTPILDAQAQQIREEFGSDPVVGGRFSVQTADTQSRFEWNSSDANLTAVLDVDADPAFYLSAPFAPYTDRSDASFSARFRVTEFDDRAEPVARIGLMTYTHVNDAGHGLTAVISVVGGRLFVGAHLDTADSSSLAGPIIPVEPGVEYLVVGRYRTRSRTLTLELFDRADFSRLVGFSSVGLPEGQAFSVDRIGLQNEGARRIESGTGSMTLVVDDLFTPGSNPNRVSIADARVVEGDSGETAAEFTVTVTPASSMPIQLAWHTVDGTARASADYAGGPGSLEIPPGALMTTLRVPIRGDGIYEADETFTVRLASATEATIVDAEAGAIILNDDDPPTVSVQSVSTSESAPFVEFSLTLSGDTELPSVVEYATAQDTAREGVDYEKAAGQLTLNPGVSAFIRVPIVPDVERETNEVFFLDLRPVSNVSGNVRVEGTIVDDDNQTLSINDVALKEGNSGHTPFVFTITLSQESHLTVTVTYSVTGTTNGVDLEPAGGTVTLPPGQLSTNVTVRVIGDRLPEPDETFRVLLSNPINAALGKSVGWGTIQNDDDFPELSVRDVTASENSGTLLFEIILVPVVDFPVRVTASIAAGSASPDIDFRSLPTQLIEFPPNTAAQPVAVPLLDDPLDEEDETVVIHLTGPEAARISKGQAVGTILDDDGPPAVSINDVVVMEPAAGSAVAEFIVTLSKPSGRDVVVPFATADATARAGQDYRAVLGPPLVFEPGETNHSIRVSVLADQAHETNETFLVNLLGPTHATLLDAQGVGTILPNPDDPPPTLSLSGTEIGEQGSPAAEFKVRLSHETFRSVRARYRTIDSASDNPATGGLDYATTEGEIAFSPGEIEKRIAVRIIDDSLDEPDRETFLVILSDAQGAEISGSVAEGVILDDENRPRLTIGDIRVLEGDEGTHEAVFVARLSAASALPVSFSYSTADGTASGGSDFVAVAPPLPVGIPPGELEARIPISIRGDGEVELDETFSLLLTAGANVTLPERSPRGTILDDDIPSLQIDDVTVLEGPPGSTTNAIFTVRLSKASSAPVTANYQTENGSAQAPGDYDATQGVLRIEPGMLTANIVVRVFGDAEAEPIEDYFVRLTQIVNAQPERTRGRGTILSESVCEIQAEGLVIMSEECEPANRAIDPGEVVTARLELVNRGNISCEEIRVSLEAGGGVTPIGSPQDYGRLDPQGQSVSRPFQFTVAGECGQEVALRFCIQKGGGADCEYLVWPVRLGVNPDGELVCCQTTDLSVEAADAPDPVAVDAELTYTAVVSNLGSAPAENAILLQRLPETVDLLGVEVPGGTWEAVGDLVTSRLERLEAGAVRRLTVRVRPRAPGRITSSLRLEYVQDLIVSNNSATVTTTVLAPEGLSIFPTTVRVKEGDEGQTNAVLTLWMQPPRARPVSVELVTEEGTATAGSDFCSNETDNPSRIVVPPGTQSVPVPICVLGDRMPEPEETFTVRLQNPTDATLAHAHASALVVIVDDDPPCLSVLDTSVREPMEGETAWAIFAVVLSSPATNTVTFEYSTADGTATAPGDYQAVARARGEIRAGSASSSISIPIRPDSLVEGAEEFGLLLLNTHNAGICRTQAVAAIFDTVPEPAITIGDAQVVEGDSGSVDLLFPVTLSHPVPFPISFEFATTLEGTAASGNDFIPATRALILPANSTNLSIAVQVFGDRVPETNETVVVRVANSPQARFARATATGTILNDDYLPDLRARGWRLVEESCRPTNGVVDPGEVVTVEFEIENQGLGPTQDLVATLLSQGTVSSHGDPQAFGVIHVGSAGARRFKFRADGECGTTAPVVIALRDGTNEVRAVAFEIPLGSGSEGNEECCATADLAVQGAAIPNPVEVNGVLSVSFAVTNRGPFTATSVRFLCRIPEGVSNLVLTEAPTASCGVTGDLLECQLPDLPAGAATRISLSATAVRIGAATFYFEVSAAEHDPSLADNEGEVRIDILQPPGFWVGDASVVETPGGATLSFPVSLHPVRAGSATVEYVTVDGTAQAGKDFVYQEGTLQLGFGLSQTNVTIQVLDDLEDELPEQFYLQLRNPVGSPLSIKSRGTGTIFDDDPPTISIDDTVVNVGQDTNVAAVLHITLSSPHNRTISVDYRTTNGTATVLTDFDERFGTATFPTGVVEVVLSIPIVPNTIEEGTEEFYVDLGNPVDAEISKGRGVVTITDEARGLISISDASVVTEGDEGLTNLVFEVALRAPILQEVRVDFETRDVTAVAGLDYIATKGTLVFAPGIVSTQIVVAVIGDRIHEPDESIRVVLTNAYNANLVQAEGLGTILNDDEPPCVSLGEVAPVREGDTGAISVTLPILLSHPSGSSIELAYTLEGSTNLLVLPPMTTVTNVSHPLKLRPDHADGPDVELPVLLTGVGKNATLCQRESLVRVLDDDDPPTIQMSEASVSEGDEGVVYAVFDVRLLGETRFPATVRYAALGSTATNAAQEEVDFRPIRGELRFDDTGVQRIAVPVIGDRLIEPDEIFLVRLSGETNATVATRTALGWIRNDDGGFQPLCPSAVILTVPSGRTCFERGSDIRFVAEIPSEAERVERIEFYAGTTPLGEVGVPPYEIVWEAVPAGDYCLRARVICLEGEISESAPVCIGVRDQPADVAIVRPRPDAEIDRLQVYLEEMGLCSQVFDSATVEFQELNPFRLVIWHGLDQVAIDDRLVDIFDALQLSREAEQGDPHRFGMPLYFIDPQIGMGFERLEPTRRQAWQRLTLLSPVGGQRPIRWVQVPELIANGDVVDDLILSWRFGTVLSFAYDGLIPDVEADPIAQVHGAGGNVPGETNGPPVFVNYPSTESEETEEPRTVSQTFWVTAAGDGASAIERKELFQNAVCWLIRCEECTTLNLSLLMESSTESAGGEQITTYDLRLLHTGECDGIGVVVTDHLPPGSRLLRVESKRGFVSAGEGAVHFHLGHIESAAEVEMRLVTAGPVAGDPNCAVVHANNFSAERGDPACWSDPNSVAVGIDMTEAGEVLIWAPASAESFMLQQAADLSGPWTDLPWEWNASSLRFEAAVPIRARSRGFFRAVRP